MRVAFLLQFLVPQRTSLGPIEMTLYRNTLEVRCRFCVDLRLLLGLALVASGASAQKGIPSSSRPVVHVLP